MGCLVLDRPVQRGPYRALSRTFGSIVESFPQRLSNMRPIRLPRLAWPEGSKS